MVSALSSTGPAGKCGLLVGDRIIMVEKTNVQNYNHNDLVAEIKKYASKDTIQLTVIAEACEKFGEKIFHVSTSYGFSLSTG